MAPRVRPECQGRLSRHGRPPYRSPVVPPVVPFRMMRKRLAAFAVLAIVAALAVASTAAAQSPQTSLPDVEDEVMCPTCGVPLSHAFSPQAERQRDFIRTQIEAGRSKDEIKQS